ncbi:MAG: hypothetical protein WC307_05210 [Candidatus Nanoarchaeia archaeon]|jgi:hypothetical protein
MSDDNHDNARRHVVGHKVFLNDTQSMHNADQIIDGTTNAIPTLTQESNWDTAYGWGDHAGLYDTIGTAASLVANYMPLTGSTFTGDVTFGTNKALYFRDAGIYINSIDDGYFDLTADTGIRLNQDTNMINSAGRAILTVMGLGDVTTYASLYLRNNSNPWYFWDIGHLKNDTLSFTYADAGFTTVLNLAKTAITLNQDTTLATDKKLYGATHLELESVLGNAYLRAVAADKVVVLDGKAGGYIKFDGSTIADWNSAGITLASTKTLETPHLYVGYSSAGHYGYFENDSGALQISSSDGPINFFSNTGGWKQTFTINSSVGSAVNYLTLTNSATGTWGKNGVLLQPVGTDGTIPMRIKAKGSGYNGSDNVASIFLGDSDGDLIQFYRSGNALIICNQIGNGAKQIVFADAWWSASFLQLLGAADAVNYLCTINSATGNPVVIEARGSDTDISINLTPKGAGNLATKSVFPLTDDTYYLGKNDDDSPLAYKGLILKDTTNGKYYRIEIINGVVTATDLTD